MSHRPSLPLSELDFEYPESLVATERAAGRSASRVMLVDCGDEWKPTPTEIEPVEIEVDDLLSLFHSGDVLVANNSRVLRRRVFTDAGLEILFIRPLNKERTEWEVLCPSSRWKKSTAQSISGTRTNSQAFELHLLERGRPQRLRANRSIVEDDFERIGELPLPPYIQKARGERHMRASDQLAYQSIFAMSVDEQRRIGTGSLAAPTASFHFSDEFLERLRQRGVATAEVTLDVGLGTFLPVTASNLSEHVMHSEWAAVPAATVGALSEARVSGGRVFALGTTVARALESMALGRLCEDGQGGYLGETDLLIQPGYDWRVVDVLLTNFHQPRSTLLALVGAFAGLDRVKACYAWAIARKFKLFSYGDLSVWIRRRSSGVTG